MLDFDIVDKKGKVSGHASIWVTVAEDSATLSAIKAAEAKAKADREAAEKEVADAEAARKAARDKSVSAGPKESKAPVVKQIVVAPVPEAEPFKPKLSKKSGNIMDRFESCDRAGQHELDISGLSLQNWPEDAIIFPNIRRLLAYNNKLRTVPSLGTYRRLEHLDMSRNFIVDLGAVNFSLLGSLRTLDLSKNNLTALPVDIGKLPLLESLLIHRNQLESLPPSLADLTYLRLLNAEYNNLEDVGSELEKLPRLTELNLANNPRLRVDDMPPRVRRLHEKVMHNSSKKYASVLSFC